MGKKAGEVWDEEERKLMRSVYGRFAEAYRMAHGEKLDLTVSDAFLIYVEIYGYDQIGRAHV